MGGVCEGILLSLMMSAVVSRELGVVLLSVGRTT